MRAWILALALLLPCVPVLAQEPEPPAESAPAPRSWQSLSPQQREVLQNFQGRWDSLPADKQQALARGSRSLCGARRFRRLERRRAD